MEMYKQSSLRQNQTPSVSERAIKIKKHRQHAKPKRKSKNKTKYQKVYSCHYFIRDATLHADTLRGL